jgi:hypothetical protein
MPDMQKVSVALTGEQVAALEAAVEAGEYATTDEINIVIILDFRTAQNSAPLSKTFPFLRVTFPFLREANTSAKKSARCAQSLRQRASFGGLNRARVRIGPVTRLSHNRKRHLDLT